MIDVTFDQPRSGVIREVLTGLRPDGTPAETSVEATDMLIEHYDEQGVLVERGRASEGVQSLLIARSVA